MRKEKKKVLKKISKKRYAIIAGSLIAHKVRCPIILPTKLFDKLYREKLESTWKEVILLSRKRPTGLFKKIVVGVVVVVLTTAGVIAVTRGGKPSRGMIKPR